MTTALKEKVKNSTKRLSGKQMLDLKEAHKKIISQLVSGSFNNQKVLSKEKNELIVQNFPLAVHIAKKYIRKEYDIQDLVQVAAIGLIKAVKKYQPAMKTKLMYYAIPTIEGEIKHYIRDSFYGIKVSRKCVELNAKIQKYREAYVYKNGREATKQEISKACKLSIRSIEKILETVRAHATVSLDAPLGCVGSTNSRDNAQLSRLEDLIGHESKVEKLIDDEGLKEAIASLNPRDQLIIKDRFMRDMGQDVIAKRHCITQAQVSRILKTACDKMFLMMM